MLFISSPFIKVETKADININTKETAMPTKIDLIISLKQYISLFIIKHYPYPLHIKYENTYFI
ncbi:hypothetical protein UT300018_20760 [Clostridium faecium]